jgi:signal transduction histidine kinase
VTHELRTPLTAIRLYGEMLRDGWVDESEKQADYHRRILRETDRLETLVERVLTKARLSSSEMKVVPGDLNAAVQESASAFSGHTPGDREDHSIHLAPDLPHVRLNVDAVTSILTNLVENARKYAPPTPAVNGELAGEPIHIETRMFEDQVVLEVGDRGPGIPREELPNVFQAFYRIGTESTRKTKGTGLGLHLVAIQVESMGGQVEALARDGGGTLFRVTFANAEA